MTPFGQEGWGDAWLDRLWTEWPMPTKSEIEEWTPLFDFYEKEGKYYLTAELPGLKKDDVSVTIDNGMLTISGKKESKREEKGAYYYLREASYGSFSRSLRLPADVEMDKVEAIFTNGLLNMVIPHKGESKVKKIEIK
jgi:HSP20 family protein